MVARLDFKSIVQNLAKWENVVSRRGSSCNIHALTDLYKQYKRIQLTQEQLGRERNLVTVDSPNELGRQLRKRLAAVNIECIRVKGLLEDICAELPNDIHLKVPDNDTIIHEFQGTAQCPHPQDHIMALEAAGWMNSEAAAKVAGRGFSVLKGTGALLEHALVNYAIKFAIARGFIPAIVPDLVHEQAVTSAGFAPKGMMDAVFRTSGGLVLAGTAEHPLLAMHKDLKFSLKDLPIMLVACGHAFRREAGQTGTMSRGLYRLHQFTKVELFVIVHPADSEAAFDQLCSTQLDLIKSFGFAGRQLEMSAGELGASAYRKRDIELWLPASKRFGEVTSASCCTDYQARRMGIKLEGGGFVHTLNATAVAVPRIIQCIAEHGLSIPAVLKPHIEQLGG